MAKQQDKARKDKMHRLRGLGLTLEKIGEEMGGISRQRVHQVIGNSGKTSKFYRKIKNDSTSDPAENGAA